MHLMPVRYLSIDWRTDYDPLFSKFVDRTLGVGFRAAKYFASVSQNEINAPIYPALLAPGSLIDPAKSLLTPKADQVTLALVSAIQIGAVGTRPPRPHTTTFNRNLFSSWFKRRITPIAAGLAANTGDSTSAPGTKINFFSHLRSPTSARLAQCENKTGFSSSVRTRGLWKTRIQHGAGCRIHLRQACPATREEMQRESKIHRFCLSNLSRRQNLGGRRALVACSNE